jgi:alanyl-tRNA synthetase
LLTEVYKLPKDRLYVTVFEGDEKEGIPRSIEALACWEKLVPSDHIVFGNKKDNFWEMGEQGPCGPCTEIHFDGRSDEERLKIPGETLVNKDHPDVIEIWNNVFMMFNRLKDGSLEPLPQKHVDTGMGFERLVRIIQNKSSNYDSDVFTPLIEKVEQTTGTKYISKNPTPEEEKINVAIRVVVDHVRAVAFAIADGQLPSNTGAGYVIRRILRRAIRYGFTFLNTKEPFINKLVAVLAGQMGEFFPEIKAQQNLVTNVIKEEEASFLRTLDQGLQLLDNVVSHTKGEEVSGAKAFELYDTFGFPKDLTALILKEKGMSFNETEFDNAMLEQKTRSRAASEVSTEDWTVLIPGNVETFVGYDQLESEVNITRIRKIDSKKDGVLYQIVLDATPFYPEGGGQVGDQGVLTSANEIIEIIDTKKENNLILHFAKQLPENVSGNFVAKVNQKLRDHSQSNHTATHLLHQALRSILGTHVEQKGSLVSPNYLRFDFSHFAKVSDAELQHVEDFVNARIQEQLPLIERRNIPFQQAIQEGAMALFGEKYGDAVRAIKFGESMELCGGTHVKNTGEIWHFKIKSEGAVAAGIRRIEAITNQGVKDFFKGQEQTLQALSDLLKNPQDTLKAVVSLQEENARLSKQIEALTKDKVKNLTSELVPQLQTINGVQFLSKSVDIDANSAKDLAYEIGNTAKNIFLVFATADEGKPMLTCYISKELVATKNLNAGNVVRELGKFIQGGGGGQPFFATAGGKNMAGITEALNKAVEFIN